MIQADCHTPVGVFAVPYEDTVNVEVFYADTPGTNWIRFSRENMSGTSIEIASELAKIADQFWQKQTGKNITVS